MIPELVGFLSFLRLHGRTTDEELATIHQAASLYRPGFGLAASRAKKVVAQVARLAESRIQVFLGIGVERTETFVPRPSGRRGAPSRRSQISMNYSGVRDNHTRTTFYFHPAARGVGCACLCIRRRIRVVSKGVSTTARSRCGGFSSGSLGASQVRPQAASTRRRHNAIRRITTRLRGRRSV